MRTCSRISIAIGLMMSASTGSANPPKLTDLLPPEVRGYRPQGPDGLYRPETLFDLIDGGAEVYRALNVRSVLGRRYGKQDAPDILVEIFDMGSSQDAFGAYHHDLREEQPAGIGQESEYLGGSLYFWKDGFYVSIVALGETEDTRRAVLELGRAIGSAIPREGAKPGLLQLLPREGLVGSELVYFHDWGYLGTRIDLAEDNLLGLGKDTEGILARYRPAGGEAGETASAGSRLLLVRYPSAERAQKALKHFASRKLRGADERGLARVSGSRWAGARQKGNLLVVVWEAPTDAEALRLLGEVEKIRGG